jgi:hypothetical protein
MLLNIDYLEEFRALKSIFGIANKAYVSLMPFRNFPKNKREISGIPAGRQGRG